MTRESLPEPAPVTAPRAWTISGFCAQYGISRTRVFAEIKAGRLEARKAGKATLIATESGEAWFKSLSLRKAG